MSNHLQQSIWPFITEFKRHTGLELSYLELLRNPAALSDALNRAMKTGQPKLVELASQLQLAQMDQATAGSASSAHGAVPRNEASFAASLDADERQLFALIEEILRDGGVRFSSRTQIDALGRELGVRQHVSERIEREIRRERRLPNQNWKAEFVDAIEDLRKENGLSAADRIRLQDTYVETGRMTAAEADGLITALFGGDKKEANDAVIELNAPLVGAIAAGVIVLALVFGLPFLMGGDDDVVGNQVAHAGLESDAPVQQSVSGAILESTLWRADTTYVLEDVVFVEAGAQLTIEPGTTVLGKPGSALVVTRNATLYARGSADKPIVFTSGKLPTQRARGDWGGLVLLGAAPINRGQAQIEGIPAEDPRGRFGGNQAGHNCGTLQYVRVEFAGFEVFANNELNGLTLGGCGSNSIIRYVQVHKALDDGVEVFGGDVDLKNIVVTGARDDSFDWDMGWTGRVQFLVVQQHADAGDNGFEADNNKRDHNAIPRSMPTFYNVTLLGSGEAKKAQRAMTLRRGTGGIFRNFIVSGFRKESVDVRDKVSAALSQTGQLTLQNSLFFDIGADGVSYFSPELGEKDDDNGFNEEGFLRSAEQANRFGLDPELPASAFDPIKPVFAPLADSPALLMAAGQPEDEFWDQAANYIGAVRPGVRRDWTAEWTAYPAN